MTFFYYFWRTSNRRGRTKAKTIAQESANQKEASEWDCSFVCIHFVFMAIFLWIFSLELFSVLHMIRLCLLCSVCPFFLLICYLIVFSDIFFFRFFVFFIHLWQFAEPFKRHESHANGSLTVVEQFHQMNSISNMFFDSFSFHFIFYL